MTTQAASEQITLYYREGSSDKVYQAAIEASGPGYIVRFAFGRRGSTLTAGTKTNSPVGYDEAKKIFDKLVQEKTAKGYTPGADGTPYQQTDKAERATGVRPQLLNPIEEVDVELYLSNDRWWMHEKFDGKRLLIRKSGQTITAINRLGLTVALPQTIADAAVMLESANCLLDGEAVDEVYHAFDLLEHGGADLRSSAYAQRYAELVNLIDPVSGNALRYAETATDSGTKRAMAQTLRRHEGLVFKDQTAPHAPGRPASGGSQLKLKFYSTCSCVVAGANGSKRSVGLQMLDESGRRVSVGNVTIPANCTLPATGQIVEVRYLYAYPGGSLYQPVYLGGREDVDRKDCRLAQLKYRANAEEDEQ